MNKIQFIIVTTLALLINAGCAHTDEWTTRDTWMQVGVTAAIAADAYTSCKIQYAPNVMEIGPIAHRIIGRQPSTSDVYMYFGTLIITNYFISRALPAKWRPYWQSANIIMHGYAVVNNCDLGLCP